MNKEIKSNYICINEKIYDFKTIKLEALDTTNPFDPKYNLLIDSKELYFDIAKDCRILKNTMEQRLQELKEKITSFVRDYNIESFDVWIDDGTDVDHITKPQKEVKVNLEIRV